MSDQENIVQNSNEISIKDLVNKLKSGIAYIKRKWVTILIISIIGALLGLCYSLFKKNTYSAVCTFVLEEPNKGGGLGQFAGLANLAGISLGGSGGGIFEGDNIIELYKSRTMIEKTLLSEIDIDGKKQTLIERYITFNNLRKRWQEKDHIDQISFQGDPGNFNRKQDSIISDLVTLFNKKILNVSKPDKKLSIINVNVVSTDELFAKEFTNKLVTTVNEFYVTTKTKKTYQNVIILQKQADSIRTVLDRSINGVASANDATPNANPLHLILKVPSQKKQVDVQASTAIYSEIVKNLELAKVSLRQEAPLIQVIDSPTLPLSNDKVGRIGGFIIGGLLGFLIAVIIVVVRKVYYNLMHS